MVKHHKLYTGLMHLFYSWQWSVMCQVHCNSFGHASMQLSIAARDRQYQSDWRINFDFVCNNLRYISYSANCLLPSSSRQQTWCNVI